MGKYDYYLLHLLQLSSVDTRCNSEITSLIIISKKSIKIKPNR